MRLPGLIGLNHHARGNLPQPTFHSADRLIRGRSAGGDADGVMRMKPFLAQIGGSLDVMNTRDKNGSRF